MRRSARALRRLVPALRDGAQPQQPWTGPTRTERSRAVTAISRPASAKPFCCAHRRTSRTSTLIAASPPQVVARHNANHRDALHCEANHLQSLPRQRSCDYDEATVTVTSSSGFVLRKVFYTVPSTLIGHRLKGRIYDDRLELWLGASPILTLPRGRPPARGRGGHAHVVNYHHVIHSLRTKPWLGCAIAISSFPVPPTGDAGMR